MNIDTLKGQVETILSEKEETRDNDMLLTIFLWRKFYVQSETIELTDLLELPRESEIGRIRRVFQNDERVYLPTSWEVAKARGFNEEKWREYLGYPPKKVDRF